MICEGGNTAPRYSLPVFFQPHEDVVIDTITVDTEGRRAADDPISVAEHSANEESVRTVGDFMQLWSASQGEGNAQSTVTKLSAMHIQAAQKDAHIALRAPETYSARI